MQLGNRGGGYAPMLENWIDTDAVTKIAYLMCSNIWTAGHLQRKTFYSNFKVRKFWIEVQCNH